MVDSRNRNQYRRTGRFPVAVLAAGGSLGALWLGGTAAAGGAATVPWVPFAVVAVLVGVGVVGWVLTKVSHGGDWGWTRPNRSGGDRIREASWR